ncbi:hypothetical protein BU15DRAFT_76649 [Melanogaster broomeanus]|nr:hypothetical protein BU15DRAFT_76649 [Melanogaster broomeanus]
MSDNSPSGLPSSSPIVLPILAAVTVGGSTIEQIPYHVEGITGNGGQQVLISSAIPCQHVPSIVKAAFHGALPGQGENPLGGFSASGLATQYSIGYAAASPVNANTIAQSAATMLPDQNPASLPLQAAASEHICQLSVGAHCADPLHGTLRPSVLTYACMVINTRNIGGQVPLGRVH